MNVNKVKKDGTPSKQGNGGGTGNRENVGRKTNIEKLVQSRVEEVRDITRLEFWAKMAKTKAVVRLEGILDSPDSKDEVVLAAVKEVLNRALGRSKEFIDHTTNGKDLPTPILGNVSELYVSNNNSDKKDSTDEEASTGGAGRDISLQDRVDSALPD